MYHVREFEVLKLQLLSQPVDIFISHEWPSNVTTKADVRQIQYLTRIKPFFKNDIRQGNLGSRHYNYILDKMSPKFWFSAHLHVHFVSKILNNR